MSILDDMYLSKVFCKVQDTWSVPDSNVSPRSHEDCTDCRQWQHEMKATCQPCSLAAFQPFSLVSRCSADSSDQGTAERVTCWRCKAPSAAAASPATPTAEGRPRLQPSHRRKSHWALHPQPSPQPKIRGAGADPWRRPHSHGLSNFVQYIHHDIYLHQKHHPHPHQPPYAYVVSGSSPPLRLCSPSSGGSMVNTRPSANSWNIIHRQRHSVQDTHALFFPHLKPCPSW